MVRCSKFESTYKLNVHQSFNSLWSSSSDSTFSSESIEFKGKPYFQLYFSIIFFGGSELRQPRSQIQFDQF